MAGFVYIMSNPSIPGLIKIGVSDKDPEEYRVKDLSNTSVPDPFRVDYYAYTEDQLEVERDVHKALSEDRHATNREFFSSSIPKAIETIRFLTKGKIKYEENNFKEPEGNSEKVKLKTDNLPTKEEESLPAHYWPSGDLDFRGKVVNGKKEGLFVYFDSNEKISKRAQYVADQLQGEVFTYHSNGFLETKASYKNDKLEGTYYQYHTNGSILTKVEYDYGQPYGKYETFDKDGKAAIIATFKNGRLNGYYEERLTHGLEVGNYKNGEKHGEIVTYWDEVAGYKDIERTIYVEGKKHGLSTKHCDPYGLVEEGEFKDGKKIGVWITKFHFPIKNRNEPPVLDEVWETHFVSGRKGEEKYIIYEEGKKVRYEQVDYNGLKYEEGVYHENGKVKYTDILYLGSNEEFYGKPEERWHFDENGNLIEEEKFEIPYHPDDIDIDFEDLD